MAMVNLSAARRHHRSRIAYAFGLLALIGAATTLVVVVRDPALSSTTRLTTPVPAPEITVVDEGPPDDDAGPEPFDAPYAPYAEEAGALGAADGPAPATDVPAGSPEVPAQAARSSPDDVRRSLFWSGVFGLAISLAGLGLVGTRRRMW
ncbi:hypothetical protein [Micromonospora sp. CPCC 205561]|uniref:hypothetical protein n=1 Tax=Micromonospora sp. CPCC 205561 TaxID=3122407 RepID=UPI002FF1134A